MAVEKCAHHHLIPSKYLERAESKSLKKGWGHKPHRLWQAFEMHREFNNPNLIEIQS